MKVSELFESNIPSEFGRVVDHQGKKTVVLPTTPNFHGVSKDSLGTAHQELISEWRKIRNFWWQKVQTSSGDSKTMAQDAWRRAKEILEEIT